jgi:PAS domain-containing protein
MGRSHEPGPPEELADLYADRIASGLLVCDQRGAIVDCNLAATEITGLARDEIVGRSVTDLTWLPVVPFFEDGRCATGVSAALDALASGGSVSPMVVGARPDGRDDPLWLLIAARPLPRDQRGRAAGAVITVTDITPQKGAETLYATVVDELHGVLHALPDLYFRLDAEGLVIDYNVGSGFDAIITSDDFLGRRPEEFMPPEVSGTVRAAVAAARLSRAVQTFDVDIETAAGRACYEGRHVALPDGGGVMIVRDITEQRRAQDELARSERLYRSLFERASVGIFRFDTDLRPVDCNEAMLAMTGRARETFLRLDLRGRPFSAALRAALDGRAAAYEGPNGRPGAAAALVSLHTQPVLDGNGAVVGGIGVLSRVTRCGDEPPGAGPV